jgi:hypothetical protein
MARKASMEMETEEITDNLGFNSRRAQYYGDEFRERARHLPRSPSSNRLRTQDVMKTKLMLEARTRERKGWYIHPENKNNQVRNLCASSSDLCARNNFHLQLGS